MKRITVLVILFLLAGCATATETPEPLASLPVVSDSPSPEPEPSESPDPKFDTCKEAKDAGYGPYTTEDPEFVWYTDGDGDGIVCE